MYGVNNRRHYTIQLEEDKFEAVNQDGFRFRVEGITVRKNSISASGRGINKDGELAAIRRSGYLNAEDIPQGMWQKLFGLMQNSMLDD